MRSRAVDSPCDQSLITAVRRQRLTAASVCSAAQYVNKIETIFDDKRGRKRVKNQSVMVRGNTHTHSLAADARPAAVSSAAGYRTKGRHSASDYGRSSVCSSSACHSLTPDSRFPPSEENSGTDSDAEDNSRGSIQDSSCFSVDLSID